MRSPNVVNPSGGLRGIAFSTLILGLFLEGGLSRGLAGDIKTASTSARVAVAKCVTAAGTLLRREAPDKPWQVIKQGETLYSGDLILGLHNAALESNNGAVRVTWFSDLSGTSPFPIRETAVILGEDSRVDLEVTLNRGRVVVANRKAKGEARVHGHVRQGSAGAELVLGEPGTEVSLELYGRWPAGVPFTKNPKPDEGPTLELILLVLKGHAEIRLDNRRMAMSAPPGPALLHWDSVTGGDSAPHRLERLPAWAEEDKSATAQQHKAALEQLRQRALATSVETALEEALNAADPVKRNLAVFALGAVDNLRGLAQAMSQAKHRDSWENGVLALRHWIGRGPGQDQKLYQALIQEAKYTPIEAETVLQLLHSFGEAQLGRPETYEMLLDYMEHDRLAIRGLAHWHLYRLAPAGRKIDYNPLAAKPERDRAVGEWRKLVPSGQVPSKSTPDK